MARASFYMKTLGKVMIKKGGQLTDLVDELGDAYADYEEDQAGKYKDPGKLTAAQIESGGVDDLITNDTFQTIDNLIYWADMHYDYIDKGSSRIVYKIDDDHALKIARNPAGVAQNKVESHIAQKLHDLPITKIHYIGEGGSFLVVDLAHQFNFEDFKQTYGISFSNFCELCNIFEPTNKYFRDNFKDKRKSEWARLPEAARRLFYSLKRHGVILLDLNGTHQWGDLHHKPVILDYGFNKDVKKNHYSMIRAARILNRK